MTQAKTTSQTDETGENEAQKLTEELAGMKLNWQRALADYQNLQKRVQQERFDYFANASLGVIEKLLPIIDMFELALEHTHDTGIELAIKELHKVVKDEGVERIETVKTQFDPETMHCVETVEGEENKVVKQLQPGYRKGNKVIRPANVLVGTKKSTKSI